jgi:hypothetical protein
MIPSPVVAIAVVFKLICKVPQGFFRGFSFALQFIVVFLPSEEAPGIVVYCDFREHGEERFTAHIGPFPERVFVIWAVSAETVSRIPC